jgi:transcriptional regulator with XRE-family HTH domain
MSKVQINPQPIVNKFGRASQEEIGKAIGVSRPTVSAWLNGNLLTVELEVLRKFCEACEVEPGAFFVFSNSGS